jgi:hypothetical protein
MCVYWKKNLQKSSSPELSGQFQSNLDTNYPCIKGIQVCTNKGQILFKGEIIAKIR